MALTKTVTTTGDARVDGLIDGVAWASQTITYSAPDARSDYGGDVTAEPVASFSRLSAAQIGFMQAFLDTAEYGQIAVSGGFAVEGFTNLGLSYLSGGSGAGVVRAANSADPGTAYAYLPQEHAFGGDVWFGASGRNPVVGNYDAHTVLHELGHALGLEHAHEGGVPADWDAMEFTVMSYKSFQGASHGYRNESFGYAQTFMTLDIAALQHLYGADFTTGAGATVYAWDPTTGALSVNGAAGLTPGANRVFQTIWDGGGEDTYDLSDYAAALRIDLEPGAHSTFGDALQQRALLGYDDGGTARYARGNVYNALLYRGDLGSLIENARGGSGGDEISGNVADNGLWGGDGDDRLLGLAGDDALHGDAGVDSLFGGDGDDRLDGGAGSDRMEGGAGDDVYFVDVGSEQVSETAGGEEGGADLVVASADYALTSFVEDLMLVADAVAGTGNDLDNLISGNERANVLSGLQGRDTLLAGGDGGDRLYGGADDDALIGGAGDDALDGGAGDDAMAGGAGDDAYAVDASGDETVETAGEGRDRVTASLDWTLSAHVEDLALAGAARRGTGNDLANRILAGPAAAELFGLGGADTLTGGAGDDALDGGAGDDAMAGGAGNDAYAVDASGDETVETAGEGRDRVTASLDWSLSAHVEDLALVGVARRGTGNDLANRIVAGPAAAELFGLAGADTLTGGAGDDALDGGAGDDAMAGGAGNDAYAVDASGDATVETAGEGRDRVTASLDWTLSAHVEDLALVGVARRGTGNDLANRIVAGATAAELFGLAGADTLTGGAGDDALDGGAGADSMAGGAGDDAYAVDASGDGTAERDGEGRDRVTASLDWTLSDNLEDLSLVGGARRGVGNDLGNRIVAGPASAALQGLGGRDALFGGTGDDTLDGGAGRDAMSGGAGADVYHVDDPGDRTVETAAAPESDRDVVVSTVSWLLAAFIEQLKLIDLALEGTGNALDNRIAGTAAANALYGLDGDDVIFGGAEDDRLDGGAGADLLYGGDGSDRYVVDDAEDRTSEGAGARAGASDTVVASVSWTLERNVEALVLSGRARTGTGNDLDNKLVGTAARNLLEGGDGDDALRGLDGDDVLSGGAGADSLAGGEGDDVFRFLALADVSGDRLRAGDGGRAFDGAGAADGDRIDLSALDANLRQSGDQAFDFGRTTDIGSLWLVEDGTDTVVRGNVDGRGAFDFEIVVEDGSVTARSYAAQDFIL